MAKKKPSDKDANKGGAAKPEGIKPADDSSTVSFLPPDIIGGMLEVVRNGTIKIAT